MPTSKCTSSQSRTLDALAVLQVDLLEQLTPKLGQVKTGEGYSHTQYIPEVVTVAEAHGFTVVGCGSSRVGVEAWPGTVAKLAYDRRGLAYNLQEACTWLGMPSRVRAALCPCVALGRELVLVQEWVEVAGPPLTETLADPRFAAELAAVQGELLGEISTSRARAGFCSPRDMPQDGLRLDNLGKNARGAIVHLDYAERYRPVEAMWRWLLHRIRSGHLLLSDQVRHELLSGVAAGESFPASDDELTLSTFAERAGLLDETRGPCPYIETDPCGRCHGVCELGLSIFSGMRALALINEETPSIRSGAASVSAQIRTGLGAKEDDVMAEAFAVLSGVGVVPARPAR